MIKYVIQSSKGVTSVIEVEGEIITALEDPSIMWLPEGEYKFKITTPDSLLEKKQVGKNIILNPVIWHSHCFSNSLEHALMQARQMILTDCEFQTQKYRIEFSDESIEKLCKEIKVINLK